MPQNYHVSYASNDDLIDEIQRRGMTVVPGGGEQSKEKIRSQSEIVVPADDESLPPSLSIGQWQTLIHEWAKGKGWWEEPNPNIPEKLMLMVSEIAEAMEDYRNGLDIGQMTLEGPNNKPCGFPSELADTVIRILDFCGYFHIDLEGAMTIKHEYNETRPHKHGGKLC